MSIKKAVIHCPECGGQHVDRDEWVNENGKFCAHPATPQSEILTEAPATDSIPHTDT